MILAFDLDDAGVVIVVVFSGVCPGTANLKGLKNGPFHTARLPRRTILAINLKKNFYSLPENRIVSSRSSLRNSLSFRNTWSLAELTF
jgi:hypothetical protein